MCLCLASHPLSLRCTATMVFCAQALTEFALTVLHLKMRCAAASHVLPQDAWMLPPEMPVAVCWAYLHGQPRDAQVNTPTQWGQEPMDMGLSFQPTLQTILRLMVSSSGGSRGLSHPNVISCRLHFPSQFLSPASQNHSPNTLPAHKLRGAQTKTRAHLGYDWIPCFTQVNVQIPRKAFNCPGLDCSPPFGQNECRSSQDLSSGRGRTPKPNQDG